MLLCGLKMAQEVFKQPSPERAIYTSVNRAVFNRSVAQCLPQSYTVFLNAVPSGKQLTG